MTGFLPGAPGPILDVSALVPQEVVVPLSDNEQRMLEQMERALYAEDPKFASAMRGVGRRPGAGRRLLLGGGGVLLGLVLLVLGAVQQNVLLGVLGFVFMLAGAVAAQRRSGSGSGPTGVVGQGGTVRTVSVNRRRRGTFMQRMEERWDRRRDGR
jgi:hypothetical protein